MLSHATRTDEDTFWDDYLAWLDAEAPASHPEELMTRYLEHLVASRVPQLRLATAIDTIAGRLVADPQGWRHVFNNVYKSATPAYSTRPNQFLVRAVAGMQPGTALDMCMGQGRNSIFLASQGWKVTGYDIAEVGIAATRLQASTAHVEIDTVYSSEQRFAYREEAWDLIVATYCPFPLTRSFAAILRRALRPGGLILIETFGANSRIGPSRTDFEVDAAALVIAFADFDVLHHEETVGVSDWSGIESPLVRFVARRAHRRERHEHNAQA